MARVVLIQQHNVQIMKEDQSIFVQNSPKMVNNVPGLVMDLFVFLELAQIMYKMPVKRIAQII